MHLQRYSKDSNPLKKRESIIHAADFYPRDPDRLRIGTEIYVERGISINRYHNTSDDSFIVSVAQMLANIFYGIGSY